MKIQAPNTVKLLYYYKYRYYCLPLLQALAKKLFSYYEIMKPWIQKQPFADIFQNRCPWKFANIHRKEPVLESLFNKAAVLKTCSFIKQRLQHRYFPMNITKLLRITFFIEHLFVDASMDCFLWPYLVSLFSFFVCFWWLFVLFFTKNDKNAIWNKIVSLHLFT